MNVRDWIRSAAARLEALGVESPKLEAEVLAAHVLGVERVWLIAHPDAEFPDLAGEGLLQRREAREPLAYIVGWREFYGRRFQVRPGVLIPRQDTEILVETALRLAVNGPVLDIGTGSGCIAITLKLEKPALEVVALDLSERALEVARSNAEALQADVQFVQSDLFDLYDLSDKRFELIATNPPYIAETETLAPEVKDHEPKEALFSGPTGLEFYERLAIEAPNHLKAGGALAMEVGYTQAAAVQKIFEDRGWRHEETLPDLAGHDRVVVVRTCHN